MNRRIKTYVDKLFEDKPNEPSVRDLKDEILANLNDKYYDLLFEGKTKDEAYLLTISSIGDIDEILSDSGVEDSVNEIEIIKDNYQTVENKIEDNAIEPSEPKETPNDLPKKTEEHTLKTPKARTIIPLIWASIIVMFLIISLPTNGWDLAWTLFPLGIFLTLLTLYLLSNPKRKKLFYGMLWAAVVSFYLFINVFFEKVVRHNIWSWSWLIFPLAGIGQYLLITKDKNKNK